MLNDRKKQPGEKNYKQQSTEEKPSLKNIRLRLRLPTLPFTYILGVEE